MGDRLAMVAFPWLVYSQTKSELGTAVVLALYTLPYVFFGTFAGVLIDRVDKRRLMILADVIRAGLIALVPFAASQSLAAVYVLSFLTASVGVFFEPTKLAIIPEIVPRERLLRANSLLVTGDNVTEMVGYLLAGAIVAVVSINNAFRIDGLTYLASALCLLLMRYKTPARAAQQAARSFARELRDGLTYLRENRGLLDNTVMVLVAAAGIGAGYSLTFLLAVRTMDGGPAAFGAFEGAIGAGFLVGSMAVAITAKALRKGLAMTIGLAVMGAMMVLVSVSPSVRVAMVPFFIVGIANAAVMIAIDTYVQEVVPEDLAGRVWGTRVALTQGVYALAVIAGGGLATVLDVRVLFAAAGLLVAAAGIVALFVRRIREA
jgi:MFS family permease